MITLSGTPPYRLKAMTTLTWPVLCTLITDAPSFLLSLAGRKPWVSVAMAIMYQKPENCRGVEEGQHELSHHACPRSQTESRSRPHLYLQGSTTPSQARLKRSRCLAGQVPQRLKPGLGPSYSTQRPLPSWLSCDMNA